MENELPKYGWGISGWKSGFVMLTTVRVSVSPVLPVTGSKRKEKV